MVAAGVILSVLTLVVPLDALAVSCILIVGAVLGILGLAMVLSPGPSIAYRPDVQAADYALRVKGDTNKPKQGRW